MEIHPPHKPVESIREAAAHLVIITIGILIALSLEQAIESSHGRHLVTEARSNILSEIRDNKKALDTQLSLFPDFRALDIAALDAVTGLLDRRTNEIKRLTLTFPTASLGDTSWTTAQTLGALARMPYSEVRQYAGIYEMQNQYILAQNRTVDSSVTALSVLASPAALQKLPQSELGAERTRLMDMMSALTLETNAGQRLSKAYGALLAQTGSGRPE